MINENDLEDESITPEVIEPSLQLMRITKESNLDPDLANEFRINFEEHFKMANEWSKKAKNIIVMNENQTMLMEQARVARLFIRSKRLEIENFRKSKKEYYLRGGQAVDKVCAFLKNIIEPIESHLDLQEHYVEYKKKAEEARLLAEVQAKMEVDRIAKEKADAKALAVAQAENQRLKYEQEKIKKENEAKIAEENKKRQAELELVRKEAEANIAIEREKALKAQNELILKERAEKKAEADKIRAEEKLKRGSDIEKMQKFYDDLMAIQFPEVISHEAKRIIYDSKSHIGIAVMQTKKYIQSNIQEEEE